MAFLDFLGNDVGGYAQGPNLTGNAGVGQTGVSYADLLRAVSQYGGGRAGQVMSPLLAPYGGAIQQQNNTLQGMPQFQQGQQQQQNKNSTGDIVSLLLKLFV